MNGVLMIKKGLNINVHMVETKAGQLRLGLGLDLQPNQTTNHNLPIIIEWSVFYTCPRLFVTIEAICNL